MVGVCAGGMVLIAAAALALGWGLNGPAIGFIAILTFLTAATVSAALGISLSAAGVLVLLVLAWAEYAGWIGGVTALPNMSLPRRLVNLLVLVGVGLVSGLMVRRVFDHYLGASREREARFQGLLGIAVDTYWELDEHFTRTQIWYRSRDNRFVPSARSLKAPWDQTEWEYEPGRDQQHYADLRAHVPFRDLRVRWRRPDGHVHHLLVSGEPRFDGGGRFRGYWGVTRNIDELVAAQEALRRSETTLSTLVATSPDMITLTDMATARYVMVNDTFTRVSGFTREEAIGRTSLELGVWGSTESREEFIRRVATDSRVQDLPCSFVDKWGRPFTLLVSAAVFELEGRKYRCSTAAT
ncbi:PAS domain S-box protein [Piscinibacter aquaticus]|uniref:PAS domain S-box protein n=1 Tax=Piscinibacter aquaticus TaxID=392597 RepID=A0A5C6U262_9BURK|nr:PAS domain S-box protein [Piscinibacter aquaticus]